MAQKQKLPRVRIGAKKIDDAFEAWARAIEAALNLTTDPASGLELFRHSGGTFMHITHRESIVAKTGAGGLTGRSVLTMGSGAVDLYAFDNGGTLTALGLSETAYTFSATAIPASKFCLVVRANGLLLVVSVEC